MTQMREALQQAVKKVYESGGLKKAAQPVLVKRVGDYLLQRQAAKKSSGKEDNR